MRAVLVDDGQFQVLIKRRGLRATAALWNGTPWRMWVTDQPNGEGKTFFTLRFSAEM
jgi:hypothetical protein